MKIIIACAQKPISIFLAIVFFSNSVFSQSNEIKTLNNPESNSFNSILGLEEFKGKVLFVDIWGVHCIPCIEEFAFNEALRNRFKDKPVSYLYLSLDYGHKDDKELWQNLIHSKNLVGYNILISSELYLNIWKIIKDSISKEEMYLIPHYILIDQKGKIVFPSAARPSTKDVLYNQIETILEK